MAMEISFKNKGVLITGGAKGLGKTFATRFYKDGAKVFVVDRDEALLNELKAECPDIQTICVDLRDWDKTREAIEKIGQIDHLINNAGVVNLPDFEDIKLSDIDLIFDVNFKSCINVSQVVAKQMPATGGSIVNMSSVMANMTSEGLGLYSCSKAAINMLTKSMALELGKKQGIRVNCICPSAMMTDLLLTMASKDPEKNKTGINRFVIKRLVEKDEVVDLAYFLLSDKASMITGQALYIEGGFSTQ